MHFQRSVREDQKTLECPGCVSWGYNTVSKTLIMLGHYNHYYELVL